MRPREPRLQVPVAPMAGGVDVDHALEGPAREVHRARVGTGEGIRGAIRPESQHEGVAQCTADHVTVPEEGRAAEHAPFVYAAETA